MNHGPKAVAAAQGHMIDKERSEGKGSPEGGDDLGRLSDLFEKSPVALTLADACAPDMPLVVANHAFLAMTGYDRDEVMGRNCRFLQADLPNSEARAEVHAVIAGGRQGQIVFRNRMKSGEPFDNLLFLQGLDDRSGTPRYFLGSQFLLERSVTERRINSHLAHFDAALARMLEQQNGLRVEQRRMFANAAYAVANAWMSLRS